MYITKKNSRILNIVVVVVKELIYIFSFCKI